MPLHRCLLLVAALLGTGCSHAQALPQHVARLEEPVDPPEPAVPLHLRLETPHGAVHIYRPSGYESATAGLVLYVHGHFITLDGACRRHELPTQFRESGVNALFVSPEAPSDFSQAVLWPSLPELLDAVAERGLTLPRGPVIALAHSGGFRTVVPWLSSGLLESVILLDALYGNEDDFAGWLEDPSDTHRLVLVGFNTTPQIEHFLTGFGDEIERSAIPLRSARGDLETARLVFLRSQFGHMELVTEGRAIPALLRMTPLPRIGHPG